MGIKIRITQCLLASLAALSLPVLAQGWTLTAASHVSFDIKAVGLSVVKGTFNQQHSRMFFDASAPKTASAELILAANSLTFSKPALRNMFLGEDFFNAAQYKTATFKSTEFQPLGDGRYSVKGDLTLRGVTKQVTFDMLLKPNPSNPKLLDVQSSAVINRSDFGMKRALGGVGDKVNIQLSGQWLAK